MRRSELKKEKVNSFSLEKACKSDNSIKNLLEIIESHQDELIETNIQAI